MPELSESFATLMEWADEFRKLKIGLMQTHKDVNQALKFGAEGMVL